MDSSSSTMATRPVFTFTDMSMKVAVKETERNYTLVYPGQGL
jgi:hypothetical protein